MKLLDVIKKYKIFVILLGVLLLIGLIVVILFNINPESFNFKTIIYKRSSVCNKQEIVSEKAFEKNLYEILGTVEYSDKIFVVNNFNVESLSFKSYKNKPARLGEAVIFLKDCSVDVTKEFKGRYEFIKDYVVLYLEEEVYIFYFNKKNKTLVDYNNYVQGGKEKYVLE